MRGLFHSRESNSWLVQKVSTAVALELFVLKEHACGHHLVSVLEIRAVFLSQDLISHLQVHPPILLLACLLLGFL